MWADAIGWAQAGPPRTSEAEIAAGDERSVDLLARAGPGAVVPGLHAHRDRARLRLDVRGRLCGRAHAEHEWRQRTLSHAAQAALCLCTERSQGMPCRRIARLPAEPFEDV